MDIKILVATHKKYWMPKDEVYLPIHVGKKGKGDLGYIGDDTGDNISYKNPNYCELTALYWAWKNLSCEYIGLCHYRRYFSHRCISRNLEDKRKHIFQKRDYEKLLIKYDMILPKKRNYYIETVRSQYNHAHYKKDLDKVENIIKEFYPEYMNSFYNVMNSKSLYIYNMFVMKKSLFDKYCLWLFDILFVLEKEIDISEYDKYNKRIYGFLAERLFNVWIDKQKLSFKEEKISFLEKQDLRKYWNFFIRKIIANYK